jgi:hypothetical protein
MDKLCSTRKVGAEEGLSSSLVIQLSVPRPLRLSPSSSFYIPDDFRGLRPIHTGSAPSCPAEAGNLYDAADFASCCGPAICSTPLRPRPLDRTRRFRYQGPWRLPGPHSHRLTEENLSLGYVMTTPLCSSRPSC